MKLTATYFLLFLTIYINAQTINFHYKPYKPKGKIIKIVCDSVIIYTDTTSLFSDLNDEVHSRGYNLTIKNFVRTEFKIKHTDTIILSGIIPITIKHIQFIDSIDWSVMDNIQHLIYLNKLKIYDNYGQPVKGIIIKQESNLISVTLHYINKATNKELFNITTYKMF